MFNDYPLRFIVMIYKSRRRSNAKRRGDSLRPGDSFEFSRKGCAPCAFQSPGDTPTKYGRETVREESTGEGGKTLRLHVRGWCFKSERPVSRARPKREQLIVMCGGRWGILIFPLNAMPRTGVHSGYTERATKKEARRGVVTRPPLVLPWSSFFLRASCGRDDAGVKSISETVFEYVVRSTVLFCLHYLKTLR